jgi:hypothetical protein
MRPWFTASYSAPCPRRCSGANDKPTNERTGPSVHSSASVSSNKHIRPRGQALIKFPTKQPKITQTGHSGALATVEHTRQTLHHGHRYLRASLVRNLKMINAVAAQCHADTPPTINQRRPAEPHTLKIKLKACPVTAC